MNVIEILLNIPVSENVGIYGGAVRNDNKHLAQSSVRPARHKVTDNYI